MGEQQLSLVTPDRVVDVGPGVLSNESLPTDERDPILAEFDIPATSEEAFRRIEELVDQRDELYATNQLFASASIGDLKLAIAEAEQAEGDPTRLLDLLISNPQRKAILLAGMRLYETGDDMTSMHEVADSLIDEFAPGGPWVHSAPREIYLNNDPTISTAYALEIVCQRKLYGVMQDAHGHDIGFGLRFHGLLDLTAFAEEDLEVRDKILAEEESFWAPPNGVKKYLRRALDEKLPTIQPGIARLYAFRKTPKNPTAA